MHPIDKTEIRDLSKAELEGGLRDIGEAMYRARQIFKWLYREGVLSFDDMTNIPAALIERLKESFSVFNPVLLDSRRSRLDGTEKYLLKLKDANAIETVFIPETRRSTVCLSSQVGCKFGCAFCASAPFGFIRNLSPSEITGELLFTKRRNPEVPITHVVFMGIGEPLDNYDNVLKSVRIFNDKDAFNIGARRITISTCGIIPGIEKLGRENIQVELSISLHSADDDTRSSLVPINRKYPLKELMKACRDYTDLTDRVVTFEYVLIKGINSSKRDAASLARLLSGMKCKVNLISYNKTVKGYDLPAEDGAKAFLGVLRQNGVNATRRKSRGKDIDAGCGQLRITREAAKR